MLKRALSLVAARCPKSSKNQVRRLNNKLRGHRLLSADQWIALRAREIPDALFFAYFFQETCAFRVIKIPIAVTVWLRAELRFNQKVRWLNLINICKKRSIRHGEKSSKL